MFNYQEISFKIVDKEDLDFIRQVHNSYYVLSMLTDPILINEVQQYIWFRNLCRSKSSMRFVVIHNKTKVGCARLDKHDSINRSIQIGGDILEEFSGKGIGTQMIKGVIWYF